MSRDYTSDPGNVWWGGPEQYRFIRNGFGTYTINQEPDVEDNFVNDTTADISLSNHVADTGQSWTEISTSEFAVTPANVVTTIGLTVPAGGNLATIDLGAADVRVSGTFYQAGRFGPVVRASGVADYFRLGGSAQPVVWELRRWKGAVESVLIPSMAPFNDGDQAMLEAIGDTLRCYVNGVLVGQTQDSNNNTVTKHGIGSIGSNNEAHIKSVRMWKIV